MPTICSGAVCWLLQGCTTLVHLTSSDQQWLLTTRPLFLLLQVCRNSNKAKERMFFLFSDMLIYARPNLGSSRCVCTQDSSQLLVAVVYVCEGLTQFCALCTCPFSSASSVLWHVSSSCPSPCPVPTGRTSVAVCSLCSTPLCA